VHYKHRILCVLAGILIAASAGAATRNITTKLSFRAPLVLQKLRDINFGDVSAGIAATYRITPNGSLSVAAGSGQLLGGTVQAGQVTIKGSRTQRINISVSNYVANKGVTPKNASCRYNNGSVVTPCRATNTTAPSSGGRTLLLGLEVTADGTQIDGTVATPSFDILVIYN
jgi:hypothetical protein